MRPFVVTDVETTGLSAKSERIVEIAAARLEPDGHGGGEVTGRFSSLVNPERSVPARAMQVHGITTGMVYDAPPEAEVLPRFLDFLGDGVLAAHNLTFDEGFLSTALERQALPELPDETLCTLRLARRLLPGLGSHKLGDLARFYELSAKGCHRAEKDMETTVTVLQKFLRQLAFEHDIEEPEAVRSFQYKNYRQVRTPPKALRRLRDEVLPEVPHAPGVYFLKNKSGATCYIGKAKDLRRRVGSHFSGIESASKRQRRLVKATRDVEWEITPGELDALLLESRRIKSEKPRFNRAGRRYRSRPLLRLDRSADFPRLSWRYRLDTDEDGEAEYFGPVRGREEAEGLVEALGRFFRLRECEDEQLARGERCLYADIDRCPAPCENGHAAAGRAAYADAVAELRAFLCGTDDTALTKAEEKMQTASAQLEFERAAQERDALERLERFFRRQERVGGPVRQYDAVLALPGGEGRPVVLHVVRHGLVRDTLRPGDLATPGERADVAATLAEHFDDDDDEAARPAAFTEREAHEARLLQQWTYRRRADLEQVRWNREALNTLVERVAERLEAGGHVPSPGG